MTLNQAIENQGEIPGTGRRLAPPVTGGRKGRLMTTYDDFFGAAFGMFQAKSICCANRDGRK